MFFSKKDKARIGTSEEDLDEEDLDEDTTEEIPEPVVSPASEESADASDSQPVEADAASADDETDNGENNDGETDDSEDEDEDEDEDDEEPEEHNDAEDEEERYLLSLARKQKWKKYVAIILSAVVVIAVATVLIVKLVTTVDPTKTALKVGDKEVPMSEFAFNYFYGVDYYGNQYSSSLQSYGIDLNGDLRTMQYNENMTWHDYFVLSAAQLLQENVALANEAIEAGYEMNAEDDAMVNNYLNSMTEYATQYNMTLDEFIKSCYGEYVNQDSLILALYRMSLAQRYRSDLIAGFDISDEAIEDYFEENKDTYQTATYRMMIFADSSLDADETRTAQEIADEMASKVTDEKSFIELSKEYAPEASKANYEKDDYTLASNIYASQFTDTAAAEWLFDANRKAGDVTVLELQSGYAVTYFLTLGRDETETIDVRHILIQPEDTKDADSVATAKAEAERIYEEWKSGDATEDSFAALAKENTADSNGDAGGLYENVTPGQMVETFNDWCFDASRKPGDTGIVETQYGFHIMYFVERNEPTWKANIRSILQNSEYSTYDASLIEKYPYFVYDNVVDKLSR